MTHAYPDLRLCIAGDWRQRPGRAVLNPATGEELGQVPHATPADIEEALAAAAAAFRDWRRTAPLQRQAITRRAADLLRERKAEIAAAVTLEHGKLHPHAFGEIDRGCDIIAWDGEEARRAYGRTIPSDAGVSCTVVREPIGVVAGFSTWNFPAASAMRKVSGALAAGCPIVLKGSEETPAGAMLVVRAFIDAGVPAGVLSLVFGRSAEVAEQLIASPVTRLVTYTGSVGVGKRLAALAGAQMKPAVLELGGHAPVIVCADADVERVGAGCAMLKAFNTGQVCTAPTRFYVDDAIHDRFVEVLAEGARRVQPGDGFDRDAGMGPLVNERRVEAMERLVADAVGRGARIVAGGARVGNRGNFFPVTVLADVPDDALAMHEEPFGPLALVRRTDGLDTAIARANDSTLGLAGYAFTRSAAAIERLRAEVEVGNLAINHLFASTPETPFGGMKDSGLGREGGSEGPSNYTTVRTILQGSAA